MDQKDFDRAGILIENLASYEKQFNKRNINKNSILQNLEEMLNKYNKKGRELIFEKLEQDADNSPSKIILSNGEISNEALSEAVSYAVNTASHIGIDIINIQQSNIEKNKVNTVGEIAITAVIVKDMIKNYDNLTLEQKNTISDNLHLLSSEERMNYFKDKEKRIDELDLEEDEKRAAKFLNKTNQDLERQLAEILKAARGKEQDIIDMFMKEQPDFKRVLAKFIKDGKKTPGEILTFLFTYVQGNIDKSENSIEDKQKEDADKSKAMYDNLISFVSAVKEVTGFEIEYDSETFGWYMEEFIPKVKKEQEVSEQEKKETYDDAFNKSNFIWENSQKVEKDQILDFQEIQQLPIALSEKFSNQEITEALSTYTEFLKGLNGKEDFETFFGNENPTNEQITNGLQEIFENFEESLSANSYKILQELASNDFGGNLQEILTNPELLQETFLPAIEAEIQKLEQPERAGTEQDEQSFEESEVAQPQEQTSATFNQETIRDELSAIPVALSNIEGIDRADIISGMQGYKQLLDSIDVSSLQGKSNDEVLQILMSKTSEIGLQGNANEILLMMSQIGFSKGGNMQIADILTTSKDVFTALVDEASKEENIDKAIQENQAQKPITDKEAVPGMRYLIEDLNFARPSENKLGDQVIANDGNVFDSTSASDTDAAQGTTSTGKLKVSAIEKHVQDRPMSAVKNQFDLISEIIKNEEKGKDVKEQDETEGPEV